MTRPEMLQRLRSQTDPPTDPWDMIVIGGGATGAGIAVDACTRGYRVLLLEQGDFGKGTSSRSTKLIHGGVRYLEQGNLSLVMEALKERGLLLRNAPHLVHNLAFVVPNYDWWQAPFYGAGLKLYDLLAGKYGFGSSRILSKQETLDRLPTIRSEDLRGGVVYFDGQFDDARLLIHLIVTAFEHGGTLLNYAPVTALSHDAEGYVDGVTASDLETGEIFHARARVVINATGPFSDAVRRLAEPDAAPMIAPSQGIHLVFHRDFLAGDHAIMVPHTSDGRVLFAIPWHGHTLVGTTDTPVREAHLEPQATEEEIEFILSTAALYLSRPPAREDILSIFAGIRPLARAGDTARTASLSRDHTIRIEDSGMVTITGGKWTTYRYMAEDCVNQAATLAGLEERPSVTANLHIHGYYRGAGEFGHLSVHGADASAVRALDMYEPLHSALPYTRAEVVWAARHEMARTVEDVLARRTRALFLNARAAAAMAPAVADILATELGRDSQWAAAQIDEFTALARRYLPQPLA
jgi:glycerol-3-phosphate dehydrogenase